MATRHRPLSTRADGPLEAAPPAARRRRTFVAIDFETADYYRDSACAVALVRVEDGAITARATHFIRPPRSTFLFTHIHGIRWTDVRGAPTFGDLWPSLQPLLHGAEFLAAHNASFDRSVLKACCAAHGIEPPAAAFECTVKIARKTWNLFPTKLNNVCDHLRIPLRHHDAGSDAEACARIVVAAEADFF